MAPPFDYFSYLETCIEQQARQAEAVSPDPIGFDRFVLRHGRRYEQLAADAREPMPAGYCFWNAMQLARADAGLTYVEGNASLPADGSTTHHAWCADALGRVVDPTWQVAGLAYFGVPFAKEYVARRVPSMTAFGAVGSLWLCGDDDYGLARGTARGWRA